MSKYLPGEERPMNWKYIHYSQKVSTRLDNNIQNFDKLVEQHVTSIAQSLNMNKDRFFKAVKTKDRIIINEYIPGLESDFCFEKIFNLKTIENGELIFNETSGLMAKALQKGYEDSSQNPVVVQGMVITSDNKLVFGVRSKPEFRKKLPDEPFDHKIMFCPAGYATFNSNADLHISFYNEMNEELNLTKNDIEKISIESQHRDIGFTNGIRITFAVNIKLSFDELIKKWKKAPHKWEYADLIGIEYTSNQILEFLKTNNYSRYSKKANGIVTSSVTPVLENIFKI